MFLSEPSRNVRPQCEEDHRGCWSQCFQEDQKHQGPQVSHARASFLPHRAQVSAPASDAAGPRPVCELAGGAAEAGRQPQRLHLQEEPSAGGPGGPGRPAPAGICAREPLTIGGRIGQPKTSPF